MSPPLDRMVLDDLVLDEDTPESQAGWRELLASPEGARVWTEAVQRRERLDQLVELIQGRPWLAATLRTLRRVVRATNQRGASDAVLVSRRLELSPLLAPSPAGSAAPPVELPWGQETRVEMEVGERVYFQVPPGVALYFQTGAGSGLLSGPWQLEEGEAPVLVVAVDVVGEAPSSLDLALKVARTTASAYLVERVPEENEKESGEK